MAVDTAQYLGTLDLTKPAGSDTLAEADDNFRQVKTAAKQSFPNVTGAVTVTHTQLNSVTSKADLASPALTGTPTAPTATAGTNTTQIATTAFTQTAIASVNANAALTTSTSASASVSITAGQHVVCTNASTVTVTLPSSPVAGNTCKPTFTNTLYSNVIDPGSEKIFGASGTRTVNAKQASPEFKYVDSTTGWIF